MHQELNRKSVQRRRAADALLRFYADQFTMASMASWFEVSMRRIKSACLHARIFGPGAPAPAHTCEQHHVWRIPAGKLSDFLGFLSRKDMANVLPSSRSRSGTKAQVVQLRCTKVDFLTINRGHYGKDDLSDAAVYTFLREHGIANMSRHDCACAQRMEGTERCVSAAQLLDTLHAQCSSAWASCQAGEGVAAASGQLGSEAAAVPSTAAQAPAREPRSATAPRTGRGARSCSADAGQEQHHAGAQVNAHVCDRQVSGLAY